MGLLVEPNSVIEAAGALHCASRGRREPFYEKQHPVLTFSKAGELETGEYGRLEMCRSLAWHLGG